MFQNIMTLMRIRIRLEFMITQIERVITVHVELTPSLGECMERCAT